MAQFCMRTVQIHKIKISKTRGWISQELSFDLATQTPRKQIEAKRISELVPLLNSFATEVEKTHPDISFKVYIDIEKGSRKPAGFDAATKRGGVLFERLTNAEKVTVHEE